MFGKHLLMGVAALFNITSPTFHRPNFHLGGAMQDIGLHPRRAPHFPTRSHMTVACDRRLAAKRASRKRAKKHGQA